MGKKKKKTKDFPKAKLKVGKKLRRPTVTDTRVSTKKLVITEQLSTVKDNEHVSYRGLTLDQLCIQLGHYNLNVRRDALIGLRQLLAANRQLIGKHLHTLIPSIARLIASDKNNSSFCAQLRALLELLFKSVSESTISSHFTILIAHILRALTHLKLAVRTYALSVLVLVMRTFPSLCRNSSDLFDCFVHLLGSQRKTHNQKILVDALLAFLRVYSVTEYVPIRVCSTASFSINLNQCTAVDITPIDPLLDFSVLDWRQKTLKSPLEISESLLKVLSRILPIFLASFDDDGVVSNDSQWTKIFTLLMQNVKNIRDSPAVTTEFESDLMKLTTCISSLQRKAGLSRRLRTFISELCGHS